MSPTTPGDSNPSEPDEQVSPDRSVGPAPASPARRGRPVAGGSVPRGRGGAPEPIPRGLRARYAGPAALVRASLKHGAGSFRANLGPYLIGGALWLVPFFYLSSAILLYLVGGGGSATGSLDLVSLGLLLVVMAVYLTFIQTGFLNAALRVEAGDRLRVGHFFKVPNRGKALLTSLLVTVMIGIGLALWVLPGLLFATWTVFAVATSVERGLGPIQAIRASSELVKRTPMTAIVLGLVVNLLVAVALLLFYFPGLGLLLIYTPVVLAAPVVSQAVVDVYHQCEELPGT